MYSFVVLEALIGARCAIISLFRCAPVAEFPGAIMLLVVCLFAFGLRVGAIRQPHRCLLRLQTCTGGP